MKRILLLLTIAFLVSCTGQQDNNTSRESEHDDAEVSSVNKKEAPDQAIPGFSEVNIDEITPDTNAEGLDTQGIESQQVAYLFQKGTAAYDNNDFESGVQYFKQVIAKSPEDPRAYYNLGLGSFKLNEFHEALQAFSKAIQISPNHSLSIQYRGRVYYMLGDFVKCLEDYNSVVELKPNDPIAFYNRGTARGQIKDYLGAIKDFDRAIELDPEYADAFFNRGLANLNQGRLHDACYDWEKAYALGHYEAEKAIRGYCEGQGGE